MLKNNVRELIKNIEKSEMEKLKLEIENKKLNETVKSYENRIEDLIKTNEETFKIKKERDALKESMIELKSQIESLTISKINSTKEFGYFEEYSDNRNDIEFDFNLSNISNISPNPADIDKNKNKNKNKNDIKNNIESINLPELNENISQLENDKNKYELQLRYINIALQFIQAKKIIGLFVLKASEYEEYIKSLKEEYNKVILKLEIQ